MIRKHSLPSNTFQASTGAWVCQQQMRPPRSRRNVYIRSTITPIQQMALYITIQARRESPMIHPPSAWIPLWLPPASLVLSPLLAKSLCSPAPWLVISMAQPLGTILSLTAARIYLGVSRSDSITLVVRVSVPVVLGILMLPLPTEYS